MKGKAINAQELAHRIKSERMRRGWNLDDVRDKLRDCYPTSVNKLWRYENNPPRRLDVQLLVWLEKALEIELLPRESEHVSVDTVLSLVQRFAKGESIRPKDTNEHKIVKALKMIKQN